MAAVTVTKQFKDDFDLWANHAISCGDFSADDMAEFKALLRIDFQPGQDQLREGLTLITEAGLTIPATIDDYVERIRVWTNFFADKAEQLRNQYRK